MSDFVKTRMAEQAHAMCSAVMAAPRYCRLGQLTGEPGTGKTSTTEWLVQEFNAVRIEAWSGMKEKTVLQELALALSNTGCIIDANGTTNTLTRRIVRGGIGEKLIIVDEANHLKWGALELLRSISDIGGAGLVIAGTDLLAQKFTHPQIRVFLEQFRQRVGAKKVVMRPVTDDAELAAYVLAPRFGAVNKTTAKAFRQKTGGNWRFAIALADASARLMDNEGLNKIDERVVETATAWMSAMRAGGDKDWAVFEPGEEVLVVASSGNLTQGVIVCALNNGGNPGNANSADIRRTDYGNGSFVEHDRATGKLTINATGNIDINAGGNITLNGTRIDLN